MIKLQQITAFLIGLDLVAAENIDTWVENPQVVPRFTDLGDGQMIVYTQTYDAMIAIERYPHQVHDAELLFAQMCVWLIENDESRLELNLPHPETDVTILDSKTADIDIVIRFEEDITAVEDESGPIAFQDKRYRLDGVTLSYAKEGEMAS
jgi:hypothetical protein